MLIARGRERSPRSGEELSQEMRNIMNQASSVSRKINEVREIETKIAVVVTTKASELVLAVLAGFVVSAEKWERAMSKGFVNHTSPSNGHQHTSGCVKAG